MGIEIERKFLVIDESWKHSVSRSENIIQGYLANTSKCSIRIRTASGKANINLKSIKIGIQRSEFEYSIPLDEANDMLDNLCIKPVISKIRHYVQHAENIWEIDVFEGSNKGLIVAEIELKDPEQKFVQPPWVGEEVSDDWRYYNLSLVTNPYQDW